MIDPQLFMQIDISMPLRLSPKTFINREDENYFVIGSFDKDNARKFLKHLITTVYSFCDWVTPEDMLTLWDPNTVNDLLKVIISLRKDKILVNQEEFDALTEEITTKITPEEQEIQKDTFWIESYLKAIETIPDYAFVLNQGAKGAGAIALEAAKRNIQKLVASNADFQNTMLAKKKAFEANLSNIDFVYCKPHNLSPICYAEKFNVFITELFCSGIFEERVLESAIYAKNNLLSSDCKFIPANFDLKVFAYQSNVHRDMVQESREFEILYGFKFESFTKALSKHLMGIYTRLNAEEIVKLSDDYIIKSFDFSTLKEHHFEEEFEIKLNQPGKVCGFCVYFELHLTDSIHVSNSPFNEKIRFMQRIFTPAASLYFEEGETIGLKASYDGTFRLLFN